MQITNAAKRHVEIRRLRKQGLTYPQIRARLGVSFSTIQYAVGGAVRKRTVYLATKKWHKNNPLCQKVRDFRQRCPGSSHFGYKEVLEKLGDSPSCYLTGAPIDLKDASSYELDHVLPLKLGGSGALDNLGLATHSANRAKAGLSLEDFLQLCKAVLEHNGFVVTGR